MQELAAKEGEVKALQQQTAEAGKALRQLDGRKNEAHNRRQEARRQEDSLKSKRNLLQEDLKRLERRVRFATPNHTCTLHADSSLLWTHSCSALTGSQ